MSRRIAEQQNVASAHGQIQLAVAVEVRHGQCRDARVGWA
jgi:hypothetical protein